MYILLLPLLLILAGCGEANGTMALSQHPGKTSSCVTGFVRVTPNYCLKTSALATSGGWTNSASCRTVVVNSTWGLIQDLPDTASMVKIEIHWTALSANTNNTYVYNDIIGYNNILNCTTGDYTRSYFGVYERTAISTAGTTIAEKIDQIDFPLYAFEGVATTPTFRVKQANAGGNGNSQISEMYLLGYYDF